MPVYNSAKYLNTAIESILNQSFRDYELIMVDDGSTDGSKELCDDYAKRDSRVVVIHQKNGGICNARNTALKIARGEYIAFSDHDDEYLPGLLEETYKNAKINDADLVKFGKKEYIINNGSIIRTKETVIQEGVIKGEEIANMYFSLLNRKILDCVWDSFIRKDIIINNGIFFDESFKAGGEDIDFITRIMKFVKVMSLLGRCYYMHYIRTGFSTSAKFKMIKLDNSRLLAERITKGALNLGIDLYKNRNAYLYQMTFALFNNSAFLLSQEECKMSWSEKINYLKRLRHECYLPDWLLKQSPLQIAMISKKYALSFFLFKYQMYAAMIIMAKLRNKEILLFSTKKMWNK